MKPTISLYLDTRRAKNNGLYPLKLRLYYREEPKLFPLKHDLSEDDFQKSYLSEKPRGNYKDLKMELSAYEADASEIIDSLGSGFSFAQFEKKMFRPKSSGTDVLHQYKEYISELKKSERIGNALSYQSSIDSITAFFNEGRKHSIKSLQFDAITSTVLNSYEAWMKKKGRSMTTVGIYLRALRTIFNKAIEEKEIERELYPFGKRKYKIPAGKKTKKALGKPDLKTLFNYEVEEGSHQQKARDFWFFSYQGNGMNMADIVSLCYEDIQEDTGTIVFNRKKTAGTTKEDSKTIIVPLTPFIQSVISKYGNTKANKALSAKKYVFPILNDLMPEEEKHRVKKNFVRFVNQHLKKLAKAAGVTESISTNWGRHSFTTNAIRGGASMEYIQDSLGHQSITTTMNYWGGFEENVKHDIAEKLMDF